MLQVGPQAVLVVGTDPVVNLDLGRPVGRASHVTARISPRARVAMGAAVVRAPARAATTPGLPLTLALAPAPDLALALAPGRVAMVAPPLLATHQLLYARSRASATAQPSAPMASCAGEEYVLQVMLALMPAALRR